ncbi:MAG: sigma-54-dependent Fis family transcriptional regulator [Gammaproteobacteria bacterium]
MPNPELVSHIEKIQSAVSQNGGIHNVEPYISESWRRCLVEHQLDPSKRRQAEIIERSQLKERRQQLERLLSIATTEMTNLYQQVAGSGYAILLTDADGVVLNYVGDAEFNDQASDSGLMNGAIWSEQAQGTNGMGTCLIEGKPVIVHQDEHFFAKNTTLTCSAAPICDPDGNLIAVLDASSASRMAQQHTMALVNMSAQLIENCVFSCAYRDQYIARFHSRAEFVNTLGEGALSFDGAGRILGANRSALFQLGLNSRDDITGKQISEIFDIPLATLMDQAMRQPFHPMPLHYTPDGKRFFAMLQRPERDKGSTRASKSTICHEPPEVETANFHLEQLEFGDPRIANAIRRAKKLVGREIPLLLSGPTGTGKGLFAKALHMYSNRADKPFVPVNCAAIPETLIESELFGYKPGAFTGANRQGSRGKIVLANGGTLFLDEIGDMPLALQARLLRVLEDKEVVPLGAESPIKVDINVISATHRDLKELIQLGEFREDLYYRLHGMALSLPPLRDRADKQHLIEHILKREQNGRQDIQIDPDAMLLLMQYSWPGNVRELRYTLRTMIALCSNNRITASDLPEDLRLHNSVAVVSSGQTEAIKEQLRNPLTTAEYTVLLQELESMRWNIAKVARKFNVSRNTLYRKMKRFGITPPR